MENDEIKGEASGTRQRDTEADARSCSQGGAWLGRVLEGRYQYYAVPFNFPKLAAFRSHLLLRWVKTLARRSQKARTTRESIKYLSKRYLPYPRILHPYPEQRLGVKYLR